MVVRSPAIVVMYLHTMIQNLYKLLGIQSVKYFAMESNPARSSNKVSLVRPEGNQHVKKIMNGARYWSDQEAIDV